MNPEHYAAVVGRLMRMCDDLQKLPEGLALQAPLLAAASSFAVASALHEVATAIRAATEDTRDDEPQG